MQGLDQVSQGRQGLVGGAGVELIKITWIDFGFGQVVDGGQDDLQHALVNLCAADAMDIAAATDLFVVRIIGVPHHGDNRPAAVGQFQQQVLAALPIHADLLVGQAEGLVQRLAVGQFGDKRTGHGRFPLAGRKRMSRCKGCVR